MDRKAEKIVYMDGKWTTVDGNPIDQPQVGDVIDMETSDGFDQALLEYHLYANPMGLVTTQRRQK